MGYSTPSDGLELLHALIPEQPLTATTTNDGVNVIIDWNTPNENGSTITSYTIKIVTFSGNYISDTNACDGTDATVIADSECTVPLSKLTVAPYVLSMTNLVSV